MASFILIVLSQEFVLDMWQCRNCIALLKLMALDVCCLSLCLMDSFRMSCAAKAPSMFAIGR